MKRADEAASTDNFDRHSRDGIVHGSEGVPELPSQKWFRSEATATPRRLKSRFRWRFRRWRKSTSQGASRYPPTILFGRFGRKLNRRDI